MPLAALLFLCVFLAPLDAAAPQRPWLPILMRDGEWLSVQQVVAGREFWLRPRPEVETVRPCDFCPTKAAWLAKVRFWRPADMSAARRGLRDLGLCKAADPCRVLPFQASHITLRDALGLWTPLKPSLAVSGVVPAVGEFPLRLSAKRGGLNATWVLPSLRLLEVEFEVGPGATSALPPLLSISADDLRWAFRLLGLAPGRDKALINQDLLSKLAHALCRLKAHRQPPSPALRAAIERRLPSVTVPFQADMESLLPRGYNASKGEKMFVLRQLRPGERLRVGAAPLRLPLRVPARPVAEESAASKGTKARGQEAIEDLREKYQITNQMLTDLAQKLNQMENRTQKLTEEHQKQAKDLQNHRKLLNDLQKIVAQLRPQQLPRDASKKRPSPTLPLTNTSASNASLPNASQDLALLRTQVSLLADSVNASHLLDPRTMRLTSVEGCWEVRDRGLPAGLFFLRPFRLPAFCTRAGELLALRRTGPAVNFNVTWAAYKRGVGDVMTGGDFFLGLDFLANLTRATDTCMKLVLRPWRLNSTREAVYDSFQVGSSHYRYPLLYSRFSGTVLFDILEEMKNQKFSTYDQDNDRFVGNCAAVFGGGNWYSSCRKANIFGPYKAGGTSGFCSQGIDRTQGDMCSPLTSVHMLLTRKRDAGASRRVVFSAFAPKSGCSAKLDLFTVPHFGLYTVTVGGGPGGKSDNMRSRPGGRGARLQAELLLRKGDVIGASAGCPGGILSAGSGGDASWVVHRSRKVLLAVAGGGGGAGESDDGSGTKFVPLPGLHGRASPGRGDAWWHPKHSGSYNSSSVLLRVSDSKGAKGWSDLRHRLLWGSSGGLRSGGGAYLGGGGGGGFEGGFRDVVSPCCYSPGGGGGSFCNATEAADCSVEEGGNGRAAGFVIIEQRSCF